MTLPRRTLGLDYSFRISLLTEDKYWTVLENRGQIHRPTSIVLPRILLHDVHVWLREQVELGTLYNPADRGLEDKAYRQFVPYIHYKYFPVNTEGVPFAFTPSTAVIRAEFFWLLSIAADWPFSARM